MDALPRLRAAAALVSVEAVVEAAVIVSRDELAPGFRLFGFLALTIKVFWAFGVTRLRPGAALGLLMIEGLSAIAALGAVDAPLLGRVAIAATAIVSMALVASSLHAFPEAPLP